MISQTTNNKIVKILYDGSVSDIEQGETFPVICGACGSESTKYIDAQEEREGYSEFFGCLDCGSIIDVYFD